MIRQPASSLFWLLPLVFLLSGCPVGLDYPLGKPGTEPLDPALIGVWVQDDSEKEVMKLVIRAKTETSYDVEVLERGSMFSLEDDHFTGWVTTAGGRQFVYFKPDSEDKYYTYCYEVRDGEILSWDASLQVGGIDAVTSSEALRKEIEASVNHPDFLNGQTVWLKEE